MEKKTRGVWALIPSRDPEDQLYNRRLISYFSLAYSAFWFQEVLILIFLGMYMDSPIDGTIVAALLGVPASLAGLGFYQYLEACKKEDVNKGGGKETPAPDGSTVEDSSEVTPAQE